MSLYIGSEKVQITTINNSKLRLNLVPYIITSNVCKLLSSDGYILKDSQGLYLTVKEDE